MMDLNDFTRVEGEKNDKELVFLGLSTCGFCRKAKTFLNEGNYAYHFVDVDKLDRDERMKIKDEIKKRFTPDILYPFLIVNDDHYISGFKQADWEKELDT